MMHTNRSNLWLAPAVFGWIAALPVCAVDNAASNADKPGRDAAVGHAGARSSIRPMDADPDGKPVAILPPRETAASQSGDCQVIGGFETLFAGRGRYRANIYRVEFTDAVLTEIRMELSFDGTVALRFSVHRALSDAVEQIFRRDERMDEDCVLTNAVGSGAPQFYSCPLLTPLTPLTLEAGYDYAIGVAWGNNDVTYGRDTRNYPLPFLHGQVLGLVLLNTTPPVGEELQFSVIFGGGAYSMQLCFDAVRGACCIPPDQGNPGGRCEDLLPSACTDPRGFFHGQRSVCDPALCDFGACCFPCGSCEESNTLEACEAEGGSWAGTGVSCPEEPLDPTDLCSVVTGACCVREGCSELCVDECEDPDGVDGVYLGDNTTCFPNLCAGACCVPGIGCADLTEELCRLIAGAFAFRGDGTTCAALQPEDECGGACCAELSGAPLCFAVDRRDECTEQPPQFLNTVYLGDALSCGDEQTAICADPTTTAIETAAACCLPDGSCLVGTSAFCDLAMGFFTQLGSCDGIVCRTACCIPGEESEECRMTWNDDTCTDRDMMGRLINADSCVPDPCGIPTGACCFNDGTSCVPDDTQAACDTAGERFQEGQACDTCPGSFGACCRPNGICTDRVTQDECVVLGGDVENYFDGEDCNSAIVNCPQLGACCLSNGACLPNKLSAECALLDGSFAGAGIACGADTCPVGACCMGNDCDDITRSACDGTGGDYQGDDSDCETAICPNVEGACCLGGGSCRDLLPLGCFVAEGVYQGPGTSCLDMVCVPGACCMADHSCLADQVLLQCAAVSGEFHAETSCAEPGLCDPIGACCNSGACTIEAETNCTDSGGIYQGDDAVCDTGLCTLGACCHLDGTCDDDTLRSQCVGPNDVFHPELLCANVCIARGACCIDDQGCQVLTEQLCDNRGGVYDGGGTKCRENLCTPGACCLPDEDETCDDTLTLQLCESEVTGGAYIGPDALCADVDCTRGSCCAADATCTDGRVLLQCQDPEDFSLNDCSSCAGRGACCRPTEETEPCEILTRDECLGTGGTLYVGNATTCGSSPCIGIDSSSPPDCAVDARQPSDPDGSNPVGWDSIEITFDGDTTGLSDVDFTVSLDPGPGDPPTIVGVSTTGNTATLELNPPIPAGQWTCFTHDAGGTSTCLGFLPADSDGDGVSAGADIQRLIDCISDVAACELWECDLDRSGLCGPADILRGVDLLNGAAQYARWIDALPLPSCPSGQ